MRIAKLISLAILLGGAAASTSASAADGTIKITGKVTAQTCKISGNGGNGADFTVALPTVSISTLAAKGKRAGRTPFNISLSECVTKGGSVHAFFEPGPRVDMEAGTLTLEPGTGDAAPANNVQIALLNADFKDIKVGAADASQNSQVVAISTDGKAILPFYAEYVATGAATPGLANSDVLYTLVYQ